MLRIENQLFLLFIDLEVVTVIIFDYRAISAIISDLCPLLVTLDHNLAVI